MRATVTAGGGPGACPLVTVLPEDAASRRGTRLPPPDPSSALTTAAVPRPRLLCLFQGRNGLSGFPPQHPLSNRSP